MSKFFIYQVLPRLFGNNNTINKENGSIEENGVGKFSAFSNKALKEIKSMGFSYIWYTGILEHASKTDYTDYGIPKDNPIVIKGNAGSPYAIRDYYDVSPDLADDVNNRMNEFQELIECTHANGLKAIIDFVPNHVARQYHSDAKPPKTVDLGFQDDQSKAFDPDNNFYYLPNQPLNTDCLGHEGNIDYVENPAKVTGNDCFSNQPSQNDWYETVKLNYGVNYQEGRTHYFTPVPDTWYKMRDILLYWANKQVDGFRCDMAEMVPVEFWNWVIPQIKNKNKMIIFIAEVYDPSQYNNYVNAGFDYLYDKVDLYDTLRDIVCERRPTSDITFCWQRIDGLQSKMLNFLENHDEQRIASDFFARNPFKAIPALIVSTTMNVNPMMIYFGQELGEKGMEKEGFSGLDGRTTIFDYWSVKSIRDWRNNDRFGTDHLTAEQISLRLLYTKLINISMKEKTISDGKFYDLMYANYDNQQFDSTKQYAFIRSYEKEFTLIVVNFSEHDVDIVVNIPMDVYDYIGLEYSQIKKAVELFSSQKINLDTEWYRKIPMKIGNYSGKMIKFT